MREIKFRAYTEVSNEVLGMKYDVPHNYNNYVMQFTGLLDKHGKPVYESDIIYAKDEMSLHEVVGTVKYYENLGYFAVEFVDGEEKIGHLRFTDLYRESIEVIGNIYAKN